MSAAAGWVLGVDFGVVNTAAALRDPSGRVSELRLSSTGVLMPSAVFCPEQQLLVGGGALQAGLSEPGALVPYPKRRLADGMRCKLAVAGQQAYVPGLVAAVFADVRKRAREATVPRIWCFPIPTFITHRSPKRRSSVMAYRRRQTCSGAGAASWCPTRRRSPGWRKVRRSWFRRRCWWSISARAMRWCAPASMTVATPQ